MPSARIASVFGCLLLVPISVGAQSGMSKMEATQLYTAAGFDGVGDLNGDGLPEVVITERGSFCYGNTGQGFWLVSKLPNGNWKLMTSSPGIPEFLKTKGVGGWPDVLVGGPGFCFPVERWNGEAYAVHRWEYEGKACKR